MTRQENESGLPSNHQIRQAVSAVASTLDLEETSFKTIQRLVAEKLGVAIQDLSPQKRFIKKCLEEETEKTDGVAPTEKEIYKAAKRLALKVDLQATTFEKFVKLLEGKMDCENLAASKPIIREVYEDGREFEAKIIKQVKKLARSSRVDLKNISTNGLLNMMQEKFQDIDLSPKKDLIRKTLAECKHKHSAMAHNSAPRSDISTSLGTDRSKSGTPIDINEAMAVSMRCGARNNTIKGDKGVVGNPRRSIDLEQGCNIPEAAGLKWIDGFFDNDTDDLVAVFDHDYEAMLRYFMKLKILSLITPIFTTALVLVVFVMSYSGLVCALLVIVDILYLLMSIYGSYRLFKSAVYSLHLAVKRDGICFVQDDHIHGRSLLAAFHIFDACMFVSKKSQTIPFDQITRMTVKDPGEIDKSYPCWWCCICCLGAPYYKVAMDTASSVPGYYSMAMMGLLLPHEFQKLVWGMKRDKGEEIHRRVEQNTASMCSAMMFDNMMKYGVSPVQPPIPGMVGGSNNTAPTTMSVSTSSSKSMRRSSSNNSYSQSFGGVDL